MPQILLLCNTCWVLNTAKTAIRTLTNDTHPARGHFLNNQTHDEHALKRNPPKPIFVRVTEHLGTPEIDVQKIETTSKIQHNQIDLQPSLQLTAITERFQSSTYEFLEKKIQRAHQNIHRRLQKGRKGGLYRHNS
jgi:hypothetical protein